MKMEQVQLLVDVLDCCGHDIGVADMLDALMDAELKLTFDEDGRAAGELYGEILLNRLQKMKEREVS